MAIILEGSDHSPVMWGKIGPYLIRRTNQGKMVLIPYVIPFNPNTPAQQNQREANREGSYRWSAFDKQNNSPYWHNIAEAYNFSNAHNAFLSSFLITYTQKVLELGDHTLAINYLKDTLNPITYKESISKINRDKQDKTLTNAVLSYHQTKDYKTMLNSSLEYLKNKGWLTQTTYGMIPYIDASVEESLRINKLVPPIGAFGTNTYSTGTFG